MGTTSAVPDEALLPAGIPEAVGAELCHRGWSGPPGSAVDFFSVLNQGLVNVTWRGDLFHSTFKYLLEMMSPICG